jgi:hypothetical protein
LNIISARGMPDPLTYYLLIFTITYKYFEMHGFHFLSFRKKIVQKIPRTPGKNILESWGRKMAIHRQKKQRHGDMPLLLLLLLLLFSGV